MCVCYALATIVTLVASSSRARDVCKLAYPLRVQNRMDFLRQLANRSTYKVVVASMNVQDIANAISYVEPVNTSIALEFSRFAYQFCLNSTSVGCQLFCDAGALPVLINILQTYSTHERIVQYVCASLCRVLKYAPSATAAILSADTEVLLRACAIRSGDAGFDAARVLLKLHLLQQDDPLLQIVSST